MGRAALMSWRRGRRGGWLRITLGTAIGAGCLWLAFRRVPLLDVVGLLGAVRYGYATLTVACVLAAIAARAWRWWLLFPPGVPAMRLGRVWAILVVGQMLNILIPARLGELARVYLVERIEGRSKAQTVATIGLEKAFDGVIFVGVVCALFVVTGLPEWLIRAGLTFLAVTIFLLVVAGLIVAFGEPVVRLAARWAVSTNRLSTRVTARWVQPALEVLAVGRRAETMPWALVVSVLIWSAAWLANYLCLLALGIEASPVAALLVLAVLQLGTAVPTSPGGLGVFQFLCVLALGAFGVPSREAVSYGILLHVLVYLPPILLGTSVLLVRAVPWPSGAFAAGGHRVQ